MKLKSANIYLRNLTPFDAPKIFEWENNPKNWEVSATKMPFTRQEIKDFVNQPQDISLNQQLRFMICKNESNLPIGCIDLFEYEEKKSVGIGILIAYTKHRNKGYAAEALKLLINYCSDELKVDSIFCNIFKENTISIRLFESCGFKFIEERMLDENKVNHYELNIIASEESRKLSGKQSVKKEQIASLHSVVRNDDNEEKVPRNE